PTDTVFILGVILIGPVAALPILRFNRPLASGLLIVVMAAAFAYGFQSHFVIPGPALVSTATSDPWTVVTVVTATGTGTPAGPARPASTSRGHSRHRAGRTHSGRRRSGPPWR